LRTNANTTDVTNTDCDSHSHSDGNRDFNRNGHSYSYSYSYCNRNGDSHSYVDPCTNFDSYGNRCRDRDTDRYCKTFSDAKIEPGTKASADRAAAAVAGVTRLSISC
jgi:hypothetical protein